MSFGNSTPSLVLGQQLVSVGYLSRAHGVRGELTLILETESPELLERGIFLRPRHGGEARPYAVRGLRRHHGSFLLSLHGVETRTQAELLRSHSVLVPESSLPLLEKDEIYVKDLPGLHVFVLEPEQATESGREIGVIASVASPAGQDIWTIITPDGHEILFPAVEQFVHSIEPENGRAYIVPPPGLLELYLAS